MASRRTRIKGIANIPQRRKPATNFDDEPLKTESLIKEETPQSPRPRPSPCQSPVIIEPRPVPFVKPNTEKIVVLNNTLISYPSQYNDDFRKSPSPKLEYPIPPSSPNKINRSRIKAVPRLGQRHASLSASESEDESKKSYRIRNDSICSSTSTQDNIECPSPQKPKEFNSVIQRKCRRTDQSRKLAEARREFYHKFGKDTPDRQKLTMIDLIFYNPTTNQMPQKRTEEETEEADVEQEIVSDEENETPAAPQIRIDPTGEIVVDEKSLTIENAAIKKNRSDIQKSKIIDGNKESGYGVFKRAKRSKDWSKPETLKFYKALNTIGTDFTLMCELFPRRTRRELKMKFKKEERINKSLIDKAIMQPCTFDYNDLKHEVDMEERLLLEVENQKQREKQMKKDTAARKKTTSTSSNSTTTSPQKRRRKSFSILDVLDSDSESELECFTDDFETEQRIVSRRRPIRAKHRRVSKIEEQSLKQEASEPKENEPGSLMVVTSPGTEGAPVYKVFMVTGKNDKQQVGGDVNSLSEAIELKESPHLKSIFTLTASRMVDGKVVEENIDIIGENNVTIPEENNITIPEEVASVVPSGNGPDPVEMNESDVIENGSTPDENHERDV